MLFLSVLSTIDAKHTNNNKTMKCTIQKQNGEALSVKKNMLGVI